MFVSSLIAEDLRSTSPQTPMKSEVSRGINAWLEKVICTLHRLTSGLPTSQVPFFGRWKIVASNNEVSSRASWGSVGGALSPHDGSCEYFGGEEVSRD